MRRWRRCLDVHPAPAVAVTLGYLSEPADAIEVLTTVFGTAPVTESHDGSSHFPPSIAYRWEGFVLWEQRYDGWYEDVEISLFHPRFMVQATAGEAFGVELVSSDGRHAGESWPDLLASPNVHTKPSGCSGPYVDFVEIGDGADGIVKVSVDFRPRDDDASIATISAPIPVYEDACA